MKELSASDDEVDRLQEAIKLYLTRLSREEMEEQESQRHTAILTFTTNLEHIGDIIDKNLMELASKKIKNRFSFSDSGLADIERMHATVLSNMKLALNVFISEDATLARELLDQKVAMRELELETAERHYERISQGLAVSIETSALHLDVIRDLKRINSHLTSVAYPILETRGELADSRLRKRAAEAGTKEDAKPKGLPLSTCRPVKP
jgi:phosphate:Na+ symporter